MIGALLSGALSIAGAAIGRKSQEKAAAKTRGQELSDMKWQFARLRQAADKGGINILSALGAGQTMPSTLPPVTSSSVWGDLMNEAANAVAYNSQQQLEREDNAQAEAQEELRLRRSESTAAKVAAKKSAQIAAEATIPVTPGEAGPTSPYDRPEVIRWARQNGLTDQERYAMPMDAVKAVIGGRNPKLTEFGMRTVYNVTGEEMQVPVKTADAMRLRPFDHMTMEAMESLAGDEMGQVIGAPMVPALLRLSTGGLFGKPLTKDERQEAIDRVDGLPAPKKDRKLRGRNRGPSR